MIDYKVGDIVSRSNVDSFLKDTQVYTVKEILFRKEQQVPYLVQVEEVSGANCFFEPASLSLVNRNGTEKEHSILNSALIASGKIISKGIKYDPDKLQYSLIPPYALEEVARNLTIGLKKYPHRDNWKMVQDAEQRYLDALIRHLEAHRKGEVFDPDNPSVYHMAAVAVNALFLLEFMVNPDLDSKVFNKEEV